MSIARCTVHKQTVSKYEMLFRNKKLFDRALTLLMTSELKFAYVVRKRDIFSSNLHNAVCMSRSFCGALYSAHALVTLRVP
jgi:hypothetical protein